MAGEEIDTASSTLVEGMQFVGETGSGSAWAPRVSVTQQKIEDVLRGETPHLEGASIGEPAAQADDIPG